jgi:beta-1,4-mannosyl-glycoprotein beta-1,4-N-acetylglucosaminyltransferase
VSAIGAVENLRKVRGPSPSPTRDLFRSLRAWRLMGAPVHRRVLYDAGWHFTYLGGVDAIIEKLQSCAGHDAVAPDVLDRDRLAARIRAGVPISAEGQGMATVRPLDDGFPAYLVQHREKFRHLIAEPARLPAVA